MNELSKYLCLLLRHQPEKAELEIYKDGYEFGVTENEVWCTEEVPVKYICDRIYEK